MVGVYGGRKIRDKGGIMIGRKRKTRAADAAFYNQRMEE